MRISKTFENRLVKLLSGETITYFQTLPSFGGMYVTVSFDEGDALKIYWQTEYQLYSGTHIKKGVQKNKGSVLKALHEAFKDSRSWFK